MPHPGALLAKAKGPVRTAVVAKSGGMSRPVPASLGHTLMSDGATANAASLLRADEPTPQALKSTFSKCLPHPNFSVQAHTPCLDLLGKDHMPDIAGRIFSKVEFEIAATSSFPVSTRRRGHSNLSWHLRFQRV